MMLFTKDQFYRRIYKEARRKPRKLTVFDSSVDETGATDFSQKQIDVQVYSGESKIYDDAIHFYCQTLRYDYGLEGDEWRKCMDSLVHTQKNIASRSLREAPWKIQNVDVTDYVSLTESFTVVLPSEIISGRYLEGMTISYIDWTEMNLIVRFENLYIRISTFYTG